MRRVTMTVSRFLRNLNTQSRVARTRHAVAFLTRRSFSGGGSEGVSATKADQLSTFADSSFLLPDWQSREAEANGMSRVDTADESFAISVRCFPSQDSDLICEFYT